MARDHDRKLPPQLTELFHRYVRARDAGRAIDLGQLLELAGDGAAELEARVERYETLERAASMLGRKGRRGQASGTRLGRFQVLRLLGSGGLAEVYLAHDPRLGRQVALKVLDRQEVLDEEARRWMLREARSLARIEHPNVLRVFEVSEEDGALLVVTEHLSGPSLAEVIGEMIRLREGAPPERLADPEAEARRRAAERLAAELAPFTRRVAVLEGLAGALATCHDNGILHRDVKPANVVFGASGAPKLLDFGLAHLADSDEDTDLEITVRMMGTPAYLAPEQVDRGQTGADPRSDQFALGSVAYELLTLRQPFQRDTRARTLDAVSRCRFRGPRALDPSIPADLERVVRHALERRPGDRYPDVSAFAADLCAFREHRQVSVAEPGLARLLALWARRNRRAVAVLVAASVLLAATLSASWLTSARRARAGVDASLAAIRPATLSRPEEFLGALDQLIVQRAAAARFDASALARAALGAATPDVERKVDSVSARIATVLDDALGPDATGIVTAMFESWRRVIDLEERVNPDCPRLAEHRLKGKVVFPDEEEHGIAGDLYRWYPASDASHPLLMDVSLFRQVALSPVIDPGSYHYVAWTPDRSRIVFEHQFVRLAGWHEPLSIEVRRRDEARLATALAYPRTKLDLRRFRVTDETEEEYAARRAGDTPHTLPDMPRPLHVTVPAFRLQPELVTCAEYARYLAARGIEPRHDLALNEPDRPVNVSYLEATAYCEWHGGRLPSSFELRVHADTRGDGWSPRAAVGEWVGDTTRGLVAGEVNAVWYDALDRQDAHPKVWFRTHSHDIRTPIGEMSGLDGTAGEFRGLGFRPAYTTDSSRGLQDAGFLRRD
jgi:hypothetical protein